MSNYMLKSKEFDDRTFDILLINDPENEDCEKYKAIVEKRIQYKNSGLNDPKIEKSLCDLSTMFYEYIQAKYPEMNKENAKVA